MARPAQASGRDSNQRFERMSTRNTTNAPQQSGQAANNQGVPAGGAGVMPGTSNQSNVDQQTQQTAAIGPSASTSADSSGASSAALQASSQQSSGATTIPNNISPDLMAFLTLMNENSQRQMEHNQKQTEQNQLQIEKCMQMVAKCVQKEQKQKADIKIKSFDGQNWPRFKNDIERYMTAIGKKKYLDSDISQKQPPATEAEIQEDMEVQCYIAGKCIESIKNNAELHTKTAFQMWAFIEAQHSTSGQKMVNDAVNYACGAQLNGKKDLEDHLNKLNQAFSVLEINEMPIVDKLKNKMLFRSLGGERNLIEQHTINSKYNYNQTLAYVRDHYSTMPSAQTSIAFVANQGNDLNPKRKPDDQQPGKKRQKNFKGGYWYRGQYNRGYFRGRGRGGYKGSNYNPNYKPNSNKPKADETNDGGDQESVNEPNDGAVFKRPQVSVGKSEFPFDYYQSMNSSQLESKSSNAFDQRKNNRSKFLDLFYWFLKLILLTCMVIPNSFDCLKSVLSIYFECWKTFSTQIPCFVNSIIFNLNIIQNKTLWIFDTGASYKLCNNRNFFIELTEFKAPYEVAYAINGHSIPIKGIGTVKLPLSSGIDLLIYDVKYMPDAVASCMNHKKPGDHIYYTIDNATDDVYIHINFSGETKAFKLAQDTKIGPVIMLETSLEDPFINVLTRSGLSTEQNQNQSEDSEMNPETDYDSDVGENPNIDNSEYSRLDDHLIVPENLTENGVQSLGVHRLKGHPGKNKTKLEVEKLSLKYDDYHCNLCAKHKMVRKINKASRRPAKRLIEFISSDISGKFRERCWDGAQYFIVFVCHFSKMFFVHTFETKDQVPQLIENFLTYVEKQCEDKKFKVKYFRSDRGTEFVNNLVAETMLKRGIHPEFSTPHTHHQNGEAEAAVKVLKTTAKILLDEFGHIEKGLLYGEAIKAAAFYHNHTVNPKLQNRTPAEIFGLPEPDLAWYPWGSRMYSLNKNKPFKEAVNSKFMKLVGYDNQTKGYRLFDPISKKVVINNDVAPLDALSIKIKRPNLKRKSNNEHQGPASKRLNSGNQNFSRQVADELMSSSSENIFNNALISSTIFEKQLPNKTFNPEPDEIIVPSNYQEALKSKHWPDLKKAMDEEMNAMYERQVWKLVTPPKDAHILESRWVYAAKYDENGDFIKFRARIVAKGYNQIEGVEYDQVFAPTLSLENIRLLLNLALEYDLICHVIDFSTAYLNALLDKKIYMRQVEGYNFQPQFVCELLMALYGLKQSGRMWNKCLADKLIEFGLKRLKTDDCIFICRKRMLIVAVFVDDVKIYARTTEEIQTVIDYLRSHFKLVDKGPLSMFLGTRFFVDKNYIIISAVQKIIELAKKVGIVKYRRQNTPIKPKELFYPDENGVFFKDVGLYMSVIGSLLFIARLARPDIIFSVIQLSRFASNPLTIHYKAAIKIIQYLFNTKDTIIKFTKPNYVSLTGFSDSDWANDILDRKSYTGFTIYLNGNPIAWSSSKQKLIAQSVDESELIAANDAVRDLMYFANVYKEITGHYLKPTLFTDNAGVIRMSDRGFGGRTKHMSVKELYVRERLDLKELEIIHISSEKNVADIFTKGVDLKLFRAFRNKLHLVGKDEEIMESEEE